MKYYFLFSSADVIRAYLGIPQEYSFNAFLQEIKDENTIFSLAMYDESFGASIDTVAHLLSTFEPYESYTLISEEEYNALKEYQTEFSN